MVLLKQHEFTFLLISYIVILLSWIHADCEQIGVNYGMNGDNLPSAGDAVSLMKNNNIGKMRIFGPNHDALQAFANSGINVIVGVENKDLQAVASSQDSADGWVNDNIKPFPTSNIKYIAVGNEVLASPDNAQYVPYLVLAIKNIQTALEKASLQNSIKVSTAHSMTVIGTGYPPSKGTFSDTVKDSMSSILQFLQDHASPFMANVYPYYSYDDNRDSIPLEYALFKPTSPVTDGDLSYTNLFDAMVDTLLSAMESLGYPDLPIMITETGWPSAGKDVATIENARTYNNNLIQHVLSKAGTPKRPGSSIETYIFALFNENLKGGDEKEKHFGLFYPDKQPVYPVKFSLNQCCMPK